MQGEGGARLGRDRLISHPLPPSHEPLGGFEQVGELGLHHLGLVGRDRIDPV